MTVENKTNDYIIQTEDFGIKILTMNNAAAKTFTMPTLTASEIGKSMTIVKIGTGKVTLALVDLQVIADSGIQGTIYNEQADETYATLVFMVLSTSKLVIVGAHGTWTTT